MSSLVSRRGSSRFRLPGIERCGYAQLSVIETALYPLDRAGSAATFGTAYSYTDSTGKRQRAEVGVATAFEPLKANDDFYLWSLLSLTLRHSDSHVLTASPYWLLKQLGLPTGGSQYEQLRQVVERLAQTVYQNTGFYNPVSQEHERWTFSFFSTRLPTSLDEDRLWRIAWFDDFITASKATGGRLLFDLDLFRSLGSPATRRLFLKLSDRFYRSDRVHLDVNDLTINGLGFAAERPLKKRKYDLLTRCIETLLKHGVITLGRGHSSSKDLFFKREKGRYVVVLYKGPYFQRPVATTNAERNPKDDPLYPLGETLKPGKPTGFSFLAASVIRSHRSISPRSHFASKLRIIGSSMPSSCIVAEPGEGIDAIGLATGHHREERRGGAAPLVIAQEHPILP